MQKIVLVHLSDIHFTRSSGTSAHDLDSDLRNELLRDVTATIRSLGGATGVLVTGDIAYSGKPSEYDRATEWLRELCGSIGCPAESVWVVPGNHDVDRSAAGDLMTSLLHRRIRDGGDEAIDSHLREIAGHEKSATALLEPLAEYNRFAARFQCSISAERPFWERDLALACGTIVRLRGLCSVLVSNAEDARGNIVVGRAQATVPRLDGVEYLTLCHHPPEWLRDQDAVITPLESRVRIQLFGHKHSQRVQTINKTVRVTAGAMHPERNARDWEPIYNVIEISRPDDDCIQVRLFQRRWDKTALRFVADPDSTTGLPHSEYVWRDSPRPAPTMLRHGDAGTLAEMFGRASGTEATMTKAAADDPLTSPNHERRLTYRFLTLPPRHQHAIARSLNVLTEDDRELREDALFRAMFRRVADLGQLAKLWNETEKRHPDPAVSNPFGQSE